MNVVETILIGAAVSLIVLWLLLAALVLISRPSRETLAAAARMPKDLIALLRNLLRGDRLPRGARVRLWILLGYLALPFDLIPDFIPVIGYADDVVVTAILMRGVIRSIGADAVADAWTGSDAGLAALMRACGVELDP